MMTIRNAVNAENASRPWQVLEAQPCYCEAQLRTHTVLPGISNNACTRCLHHHVGTLQVMQPPNLLITRSCHLAPTTLAVELASSDTRPHGSKHSATGITIPTTRHASRTNTMPQAHLSVSKGAVRLL